MAGDKHYTLVPVAAQRGPAPAQPTRPAVATWSASRSTVTPTGCLLPRLRRRRWHHQQQDQLGPRSLPEERRIPPAAASAATRRNPPTNCIKTTTAKRRGTKTPGISAFRSVPTGGCIFAFGDGSGEVLPRFTSGCGLTRARQPQRWRSAQRRLLTTAGISRFRVPEFRVERHSQATSSWCLVRESGTVSSFWELELGTTDRRNHRERGRTK